MSARNFDFETAGTTEEVDFGGMGAALARKKSLIVMATVGAAAAAAIFCMVVKPRYEAEARILVENQESYFTRPEPELREPSQIFDTEAVNSQMQLLTSRDLARKAVTALHLQGNPEFDPAAAGFNPLTALSQALGLSPAPQSQSMEDRLLTNFFDRLTVMSPTKSRVLQVVFSSRDPDLAARGANEIADLFIDLKGQAKRDNARQAAQSLKPLIASLEARVAEADGKVAAYRVKYGLFESSENTTVPTQQLGELATRLAEARAVQSDAQAKAKALRELLATGRLGDASEISSGDLVKRIANQLVAVRAQLALESRTLLPGHPRIKELGAQLSDLETQLRAAVDKGARTLENDARVAGVKVANLQALMEEQKRAVGASDAESTQLRELQRDSKTLKTQLEQESAKYQAAMSRDVADTAPPDARIISRAMAPSLPVFPKKLPLIIFGAIAGLFFSVGSVLAGQLLAAPANGASHPVPPAPRQAGGGPVMRSSARRAGAGAAAFAAAGASRAQKPFFSRLKQAVSDYSAPNIPLDADGNPIVRTPEPELPADDVWVRIAEELPAVRPRRRAGAGASPSAALVARIRDLATPDHGARTLLVSAETSAPACFALSIGRALAREGRAVLIQTDEADSHLLEALARAAGDADVEAPGLAQILSGEASFAETIFRDSLSRLHVVPCGGPTDAPLDDVELVLDALQATYDYVLIAASFGASAADLAPNADLCLIFAEDENDRAALQEEFHAAGARAILPAGLDALGEIVEAA